MAKIYTEIKLDKMRNMRLGYKIIKKISLNSKALATMNTMERSEYMIFMALSEDDATLKLEQIEDFIDEFGADYIGEKLMETIKRDFPSLLEVEESSGELEIKKDQ